MATAHHPEEHEYLSVAEAARLLRVDPSTIWRWIKAGRLPAHRLGPRTVRIHRADVDAVQPSAARITTFPPQRALTLAEAKATLGKPISREEAARRRAWYEEWKRMERPNISPLTTADLVQMGREKVTNENADEWIRKHARRGRLGRGEVVSD